MAIDPLNPPCCDRPHWGQRPLVSCDHHITHGSPKVLPDPRIERVAQHQQLPPFRVRVAAFPWFVSPVRRDKHHGLSCLSLPDTPRKARCGVGNCRFYTTLGPFDLRWGKTIKKKRPTPPESFPHTPDPFPLDHPTVPISLFLIGCLVLLAPLWPPFVQRTLEKAKRNPAKSYAPTQAYFHRSQTVVFPEPKTPAPFYNHRKPLQTAQRIRTQSIPKPSANQRSPGASLSGRALLSNQPGRLATHGALCRLGQLGHLARRLLDFPTSIDLRPTPTSASRPGRWRCLVPAIHLRSSTQTRLPGLHTLPSPEGALRPRFRRQSPRSAVRALPPRVQGMLLQRD